MGVSTTSEFAIPASSATPSGSYGAVGALTGRHLGQRPAYDITLRADTVDLS